VTRAPAGLARYTTAGQPGPVPGRPAAPPGLPRLLPVVPSGQPTSLAAHLTRYGPRAAGLTERSRAGLLREVQESGLTGRGGAAFPAFVKLSTVADGRDPVVIANGTEGEPASAKDKVILTTGPHLVLDGAVLAAELTGARQVIVVAHCYAVAAVSAAAAERGRPGRGRVRITVRAAAEGFVAGEARAVVNWLEYGRPVPTPAYPRIFERGLGGAPTLLHNVETLAHLALIGRYGAAWFRSAGTPAEPGSMLVTVIGAVREPSVLEIGLGTPVRDILALAGGPAGPLQAVLLGGYFGSWALAEEVAGQPFSAAGLAGAGAAPGAGLIAALPADACGLAETARVVRYLADSSAGQCGPCLFGLDAVAGQVEQLARGGPDGLPLLRRWLGQVDRRGACAHPDGAVRLVRSAPAGLRVRTRPAQPGLVLRHQAGPRAPGTAPAVSVTVESARSPDPGRPVLRVDPIACAGRGLCAELLPELITLDDWGFPMIADRGVPPHLAADARATVKACPLLALRLIPGPGPT